MHKEKRKMKGISLSLETVILLILMAIVLAALLGFFLGTFNPAKGKFDVLKQRDSLCLQYVSIDPKCDISAIQGSETKDRAQKIIDKLSSEVLGKPSGEPVCTGDALKDCCVSWCPKNT